MGISIRELLLILILLVTVFKAEAQIDDNFRNNNAVLLYRFLDTTGDVVVDSANAKFGAPLNLKIYYPLSVDRTVGELYIKEPNFVVSTAPATKLINECKRTGELTIELDVTNNESVEKRSGKDSKGLDQPLRIVTLSSDLMTRNFSLGQFYDDGNMYKAAVNTSSNEDDAGNKGNSLREPLNSSKPAIFVPTADSPGFVRQKVIFTLNKDRLARLYVTDKNGNLYLEQGTSLGFAGDFSKWRSTAYFALGNEALSITAAANALKFTGNLQGCNPDDTPGNACLTTNNRYWKGRLNLVAVYCQALTPTQILGSAAPNSTVQPSFAIDLNDVITPARKRAQEIYTRITGKTTTIDNPLLKQMEVLINQGNPVAAAALATNEPGFYNITLRDFAARMSNREESINVPLNDFVATIIGSTRDDMNAQLLLSENMVYQGDPLKAAVPSDLVQDMLKSNNHYDALSKGGYNLADVLVRQTQKMYDGTKAVDNPTPAGLLTTRQWLSAHAVAGTNRRLIEFSFRQFMCIPIEKWADSNGPDSFIGRDIDRFPGGSHAKFTTTCKACHSMMDPLRGAFVRFTFSNGFVKNSLLVPGLARTDNEDTSMGMRTEPAYVALKYNHNETVFPSGRVTEDDSFVNYATNGANAQYFGWKGVLTGHGPMQFGQMLAAADAFPRCMAKRVYQSVCKREPASFDEAMLKQAATEFQQNGYKLRYLFQKIVTTPECLGVSP